MKHIIALLFVLCVSFSAIAADSIILDGKEYRGVQPKSDVVTLKEGQSVRVREVCDAQKQVFEMIQICTWEKTVTGTKDGGVEVTAGGIETKNFNRVGIMLPLLSIGFMIMAMIGYYFSFSALVAFATAFAAAAAALVAVICVVGFVAVATTATVFATTATAFVATVFASVAEQARRFYLIAIAHIVFMAITFFLIV